MLSKIINVQELFKYIRITTGEVSYQLSGYLEYHTGEERYDIVRIH
jgi:hypothetical protein